MAEQSGGEKTLPASEAKKRRAREEGNIAKSQDLTSAWTLLVALLAVRVLGPSMFSDLVGATAYFFGNASTLMPDMTTAPDLLHETLYILTRLVMPFMLIMLVAGLAMNLLQVGVLFTGKPLIPKPERINPFTGLGKFFTIRSLVELIKSLLKISLVVYIAYITYRSRLGQFPILGELPAHALVPAIASFIFTIWWRIILLMLVLGILDYGYQRWQHEYDLKMTVQEAKEEAKQFEGDPHIRGRIRQVQRQMAMQRMMKDVPTADVIITNPVRYAIALRYDMDDMAAPVVVAKGARIIAEQIRNIAIENHVPIVQKPELARALYRTVDTGHPIPEKLFRAVAEILAYVYRIDRRAEKRRERRQQARTVAAQPA